MTKPSQTDTEKRTFEEVSTAVGFRPAAGPDSLGFSI